MVQEYIFTHLPIFFTERGWNYFFRFISCPKRISTRDLSEFLLPCGTDRNIFEPPVQKMPYTITSWTISNVKHDLFTILIVLSFFIIIILLFLELGKSTVAIKKPCLIVLLNKNRISSFILGPSETPSKNPARIPLGLPQEFYARFLKEFLLRFKKNL